MSRRKFNLGHKVNASEAPSLNSKKLEKVMFYFGDAHSSYTINSTREREHKARIADTIHMCSQFDYIGLQNRDRHTTGGTEKIPVTQLKVPLPSTITPDVSHVLSMYVTKNHRMIGIFRENIFIVLFVDYDLKLYRH